MAKVTLDNTDPRSVSRALKAYGAFLPDPA